METWIGTGLCGSSQYKHFVHLAVLISILQSFKAISITLITSRYDFSSQKKKKLRFFSRPRVLSMDSLEV